MLLLLWFDFCFVADAVPMRYWNSAICIEFYHMFDFFFKALAHFQDYRPACRSNDWYTFQLWMWISSRYTGFFHSLLWPLLILIFVALLVPTRYCAPVNIIKMLNPVQFFSSYFTLVILQVKFLVHLTINVWSSCEALRCQKIISWLLFSTETGYLRPLMQIYITINLSLPLSI